MLERLTKYFDACASVKQSMIFELTWDKTMDWYLTIGHRDSGTTIYACNNTSLNVLCAEGYLALVKWANEYIDLEDIEGNL